MALGQAPWMAPWPEVAACQSQHGQSLHSVGGELFEMAWQALLV